MTTTTPRVPPGVIANVQQRWPDRADAWAGGVETELHELCARYDATPQRVLPARYGFVIAADTPHGPIVLRSSPDPHGSEQTTVAIALAELDIAPTVHETVTTDHGTWTVLDQVRPGTPLAAADPSTITIDALFSPLAAMNGRPAPISGMPPITNRLCERLEDNQLADLRPGTTIAPANQRREALAVLDQLALDLAPGLCHGDASLRNILANDLGSTDRCPAWSTNQGSELGKDGRSWYAERVTRRSRLPRSAHRRASVLTARFAMAKQGHIWTYAPPKALDRQRS